MNSGFGIFNDLYVGTGLAFNGFSDFMLGDHTEEIEGADVRNLSVCVVEDTVRMNSGTHEDRLMMILGEMRNNRNEMERNIFEGEIRRLSGHSVEEILRSELGGADLENALRVWTGEDPSEADRVCGFRHYLSGWSHGFDFSYDNLGRLAVMGGILVAASILCPPVGIGSLVILGIVLPSVSFWINIFGLPWGLITGSETVEERHGRYEEIGLAQATAIQTLLLIGAGIAVKAVIPKIFGGRTSPALRSSVSPETPVRAASETPNPNPMATTEHRGASAVRANGQVEVGEINSASTPAGDTEPSNVSEISEAVLDTLMTELEAGLPSFLENKGLTEAQYEFLLAMRSLRDEALSLWNYHRSSKTLAAWRYLRTRYEIMSETDSQILPNNLRSSIITALDMLEKIELRLAETLELAGRRGETRSLHQHLYELTEDELNTVRLLADEASSFLDTFENTLSTIGRIRSQAEPLFTQIASLEHSLTLAAKRHFLSVLASWQQLSYSPRSTTIAKMVSRMRFNNDPPIRNSLEAATYVMESEIQRAQNRIESNGWLQHLWNIVFGS